MSFVCGCLAQDEGFGGRIFDGGVRRDGVSGRKSVELLYVAVVTECVGPPAGVLELVSVRERCWDST